MISKQVSSRDEALEESAQFDSSQDATVPLRHSVDDTDGDQSKSLLSRKGIARRNSLQTERNRTASGKKHQSATSLKADNDAKNAENKRHSAHDLSKSSHSTGNLMPPPRATPGSLIHFHRVAE